MTSIFIPGLSYGALLDLVEETANQVKSVIALELRDKQISIMIDGWSDQSLRRYVGVVAAYYDHANNRIVHRFLDLNGCPDSDHSAESQVALVRGICERYSIMRCNVTCLCSDSALVNPKIAETLDVEWMPCLMHLWNLVVRNFVRNVPDLEHLLGKINDLRKRTLWIEFLAQRRQRRNIAGYCPTRWCTAFESVESFFQLSAFVTEFQSQSPKNPKSPKFTESDVHVASEVRNLLRLMSETNELLSQADNREGLATVFEALNAMYLVLLEKAGEEGPIQPACRQAVSEMETRFFRLDSRYCCRILYAGILNVVHGIPKWLAEIQDKVISLMIEEIEMLTGSTPPMSPLESQNSRYNEQATLSEMINGTPVTSVTSGVFDEVLSFLGARDTLRSSSFTGFWKHTPHYSHVSVFAEKLRSYPTTTLWVERSFSKARRVLSWQRLRLSQESAARICLLSVNAAITKGVLGLDAVIGEEIPESDFDTQEEPDEVFTDDE